MKPFTTSVRFSLWMVTEICLRHSFLSLPFVATN